MKAQTEQNLYVAEFERDVDLLEAVKTFRQQGYVIHDVYTPYPVHGLDEAMGLRPTRLTWVCLICGAVGTLLALWLQYWTSVIDWPLNVGGKPFNSLPAFIPVTFELTVLLAGLGSVAALFARCRLYPGRKPIMPDPRVTDDRFVLVLVQSDAAFNVPIACRMARRHRAVCCGQWVEGRFLALKKPGNVAQRASRRSCKGGMTGDEASERMTALGLAEESDESAEVECECTVNVD